MMTQSIKNRLVPCGLALLFVACATSKPAAQAPAPAPVQDAPAAPAAPAASAAPGAPAATPDAPFRNAPPGPGAPVTFRAPQAKTLSLDNGLPVYFVERHDVPLVTLDLALRSGADTEPKGKQGLASLAVDMLEEGTQGKDAAAIALGFEDLAARFEAQSQSDSTHLRMTALSSTLEQALELYADVALHPAFREADLTRVRAQRLGQIAQAMDDPAATGHRVLERVLYGENHPWAFPAEGTVESIKALKRKDLADWHAAWFKPDNAVLVVVGDTRQDELLNALNQRFGSWKRGNLPKLAKHSPPPAAKRTVYVIDKPDAPQSQIWIGEMGLASTAPDIVPARLMNAVLGGTFNSRLNGNLRTEHAWSYGVFSFFDQRREAGPFIAAGGVMSDKTAEALGEFVKEMTRMQKGDITAAELSDAKDQFVRGLPAQLASNEATAGALAQLWARGLPIDYYSSLPDTIAKVSADDVARAARDRLHPEHSIIVVVGPRKLIEAKLAALHLGKLEVRDATGIAVKAAKAQGAGKAAGK